MIMTPRTKTLLLTSSAIPAFMLLAFVGNASARSAETILLAQQQEPAEKSDRPDRRRPEGAPGQPPAKQGQPPAPPAKQGQPPAPPAPSAPPAKQVQPP